MKKIFLSLLIIAGIIFVFQPILAGDVQGPTLSGATLDSKSGIIPDEGKLKTGDYGLNDLLKVGINVSDWILGIVGSVSLLMFVYGGLTFLVSGGSNEKVEKGKQIIKGSIIGLVIVFSSYAIIHFVLETAGVVDKNGKFVDQTANPGNWNTAPAK